MAIPPMGSNITNEKRVAVNSTRAEGPTGALRPRNVSQIEHLLRERVPLRGICRTVGVSLIWLLHFMVECFTACPDHLYAQAPTQPAQP